MATLEAILGARSGSAPHSPTDPIMPVEAGRTVGAGEGKTGQGEGGIGSEGCGKGVDPATMVHSRSYPLFCKPLQLLSRLRLVSANKLVLV